jgi:hypothetical protein
MTDRDTINLPLKGGKKGCSPLTRIKSHLSIDFQKMLVAGDPTIGFRTGVMATLSRRCGGANNLKATKLPAPPCGYVSHIVSGDDHCQ